jgi:hypothetical protein
MLSDVMEHFGLTKSLRHVDFFATDHHRQLLKDLKAAIYQGGIVAIHRRRRQWQNDVAGADSRAAEARRAD